MVVISNLPEYQTNKQPTTPTNRVLSSLLSRERFLFLLHYGFAYVEKKKELETGETIVKLEKHVMRYQQLFASLAIRRKLGQGVKSGIIWHTQGSGKSLSMVFYAHLLQDALDSPTIVVMTDRIDLDDQLYAQLMHEIQNGERYWLTKDEERALMEHNLQYQRLNGLGEMLMAIVQKPRQDEEGQWVSLKELSSLLKTHFKGYKEDEGTFRKIGNYLNRPEYKFRSKHTTTGSLYWVKMKV